MPQAAKNTTNPIQSCVFHLLKAFVLLSLLPSIATAQSIPFTQQEQDWISNHQQISVGIDNHWPPIDFVDKNGVHQGISSDILELISQASGIQFSPRSGANWEDMLTQAREHKIDIVSTLAKNSEREKYWDFTNSYFSYPYVIATRKQDNSIDGLDSLAGKTVAIERGYYLYQDISTNHPDIKLKLVDNTTQALQAVSREQADAYLGNQTVIFYLIEQERLTNLKVSADAGYPIGELHFGVRKDWPQLVSIINKVLENTPKQTFKNIERKWLELNHFPDTGIVTDSTPFQLTKEEQLWLQRHDQLKVGIMDNWPPFDFVNAEGDPEGIGVELIQLINQRLDNRLSIVPGQWKQIYQQVSDKKLDLIMDITAHPQREKDFNFTQPYLDIPHVIVSRRDQPIYRDENDLQYKTLALEKGFGNVQYFQQKYPSIKLKLYADTEQALEAVSREEADAYAGNRVVALYLMEKLSLSNLKVHGRLNKPGSVLSIGVRKDYPILAGILQKALDSIGPEQIRQIKNNWIYQLDNQSGNELLLSDAETRWLAQHRVIPVAVLGNWPPLDFFNPQQQHAGISADYLAWLGDKLGVKFTTQQSDSVSDMVNDVLSGAVAAAASITFDQSHDNELLYTRPYYLLKSVIVEHNDNPVTYTIKSLSNKTVSIAKNSPVLQQLRADYPSINLILKPSTLDALQAVENGETEAYIGNQVDTRWIIRQHNLDDLKMIISNEMDKQPLGLAVSRDSHEWTPLIGIIDKALSTLQLEDQLKIDQRWLENSLLKEDDLAALHLSKESLEWLKNHPVIRPGIDTKWQPLEYLDEQGKYQGLSSDFMKYFARQLAVRLEQPEDISWSQVLEGLKNKTIDIAPLLIKTKERSEYLNFTRPYLTFPVVIFNQRGDTLLGGLTDLLGKKVGLVDGYAISDLIAVDYSEIKQVKFNSTQQGLEALATGQIDAFIDVLSVGAYLIASNGMSNLQVAASTPYQHDFSIGVRKDWPELVTILNQAIDHLPVSRKNEFLKKWLVVKYQKEIDYSLLAWVVVIAFAIFAILAFRAREMARVNAQLKEGRERLTLTLESAELGSFELTFPRQAPSRFNYDEAFALHHDMPQQYTQFNSEDEFFVYIHPDYIEQVKQQLRRYVKGETSQFKVEYQTRHTQRWVLSQGRIFERDSKGWAHRIVGISQDINDHKKAQLALEQSSRFKSQFLANMSHEIRTPMNAIVGLGYLLSRSQLSCKQSEYVTNLQKSAKTLLGLIDDILDFSKIEAGHLKIDNVEFNLDELLKDLAEMTALRISQNQVEFIYDLDAYVPTKLVGDSFRLNQVLNNLVSNAIKFTESGNIVLKVNLEDREKDKVWLLFSVTDTGIGIEKKSLATLFDPFIQEDGSTTRKYGGTGLGLSISRQLTHLMGGELQAESTKGVGSRFYFRLPFKVVNAQGTELNPPRTDLRGMRVLLVDDNSTSLKVLTETLLSLNFKVSSVESGAKAVDKLMRARKPYDLVLLDWRMPKLDGISTAKLIRQKLSLKKMPLIILMSAYGKDLVDKDSQELQLDGILVKPITPSSLFNAIIQAKNNVKREAPRNEAEVTAKKSIQALSGHIILAEDNMINQQVAVEILHQMGVEVSVCENGLEVLKQLQQQTPDLILMDIQMPEMDGYETTQKIREQQKFEHLPIIAMTANAMKDDIHKSLQAGMQGHISKPVDPALLYQTLSEYLGFAQNQARKPQKQPEDDEEFQPWPESVAGLNIKLGIKQVGGNEKLYQKLLKDFLHNHEHLAKDMKKMLNSSDPSQATRAAHTLKGVSANIGAERLHRISSDIDNRLKNELTIDNSILQEFSKACDELCGSIHQLIAPTAEREKPGASSAPINKIELDNLLQGLRIGDAESRNNVQKLSTSLESLLGKEKFEQLTQLIQDYEFEAAADILSTAQFEDVNDD